MPFLDRSELKGSEVGVRKGVGPGKVLESNSGCLYCNDGVCRRGA